jgi:hypothetical protein
MDNVLGEVLCGFSDLHLGTSDEIVTGFGRGRCGFEITHRRPRLGFRYCHYAKPAPGPQRLNKPLFLSRGPMIC